MKQLLVLVGPKGAGKSTIGHLLETELGIPFLRVEPLFLELRAQLGASHPLLEQRGFQAVRDSVREALSRHDVVCFETTGASPLVLPLISELRPAGRLLLVHVLADAGSCLKRIHGRDTSIHIPVSDDRIEQINAAAAQVALPWDAEIDNRGPFDQESVLATIRALLGREVSRAEPG